MNTLTKRCAAVGFAAVLIQACGGTAGEPVSAPYEAAAPPVVEGDLTHYPTPAETLFVRPAPEGRVDDLALIFYRGRGVARMASGLSYLPDPQGSRVLVVGRELTVVEVIGGPSEDDGGLGQPLSAAATQGGGVFVADAEHAEGLVYFDPEGSYAGSARPPVSNPDFQMGPDGVLWASRTPYLLRFEETALDEPLLYRFDPLEGTGIGIANIEPVAAPAWNRVANAGPVAAGRDGTGYFAFFLRNELRAYTPDGDLLWRSARALHYDTYEPVFAGAGADLRYNVRPVTQALSFGPNGKLYALTAPDTVPDPMGAIRGGGQRRIEVYSPDSGELLRATLVPSDLTTFAADPDGRVFHLDPMRIDATAPAPERPPLPDIPLITFGGDTTTFAEHRGKALLVNFWASWCAPCRAELPKLNEYYETLDLDRVEFLAISVDEDRDAGLDFIEPFEVPFPIFYGGPEMQEYFHYMGLPFTLIVDRRGRIVEEIHGFGSADTWEYLTGKLQDAMGETASPREDHDQHGNRDEDSAVQESESETATAPGGHTHHNQEDT